MHTIKGLFDKLTELRNSEYCYYHFITIVSNMLDVIEKSIEKEEIPEKKIHLWEASSSLNETIQNEIESIKFYQNRLRKISSIKVKKEYVDSVDTACRQVESDVFSLIQS